MKTWKIPVCWSMMGVVKVEADTLEEAIEIARDEDGIIPIPDNGSFLDGSWELAMENVGFLRECYNDGQKDNEDNYLSIDDIVRRLNDGIDRSETELEMCKQWLLEFQLANDMTLRELDNMCFEDSV